MDTKYKTFKKRQNSQILYYMLKVKSISLKIVKLNPWIGFTGRALDVIQKSF